MIFSLSSMSVMSEESVNETPTAPGRPLTALVWDLPVRIIHWSLLVAVLGSWLTRELEGDWFAWHTRFGYAVLVLVVTRVLWGVFGTRHSQFARFVTGPKTVLDYLRGSSQNSVGHNPLGALMILAMLAMLLAQAVTGLFANDQVFETGPLFGYVTIETSDRLTTLHKQLFDWIAAAIAVHVAAAFFYLWIRRENLILPMITGRKPIESVPEEERISSSRLWLAIILAVLVGAALAWVIQSAPEASLYVF
jgi:cytochrome b